MNNDLNPDYSVAPIRTTNLHNKTEGTPWYQPHQMIHVQIGVCGCCY